MREARQSNRPHTQRMQPLWYLGPIGWGVLSFIFGFASCWTAFKLSPWSKFSSFPDLETQLIISIIYGFCLVGCAEIFNVHTPGYYRSFLAQSFQCVSAALAATVALVLGLYLVSYKLLGRYIVAEIFICSALALSLSHFYTSYKSRSAQKQLLLLADINFSKKLGQRFQTEHLPFKVSGFVDLETTPCNIVVGQSTFPIEELADVCQAHAIHEIVVEKHHCAPPQVTSRVIDSLFHGVQISSFEAFTERVWQMTPIEHIDERWLHNLDLKWTHPFYQRSKRLLDVVVAGIGLIVSFPLLLIAAAFIKLQDRGPILYSQIRVGRFGEPFQIFKLRTMSVHAEASGPQWAQKKDPRITFLGKLLRKTRIDELPQFINILRGEMSLIGPRPERPEFVHLLETQIPFYRFRHLIDPGLTGWAQVNYPYGASVEDAKNKLCYDLYYIKNLSFFLDIQIILKTIGSVFKGSR